MQCDFVIFLTFCSKFHNIGKYIYGFDCFSRLSAAACLQWHQPPSLASYICSTVQK